jgi:hypothetical protein
VSARREGLACGGREGVGVWGRARWARAMLRLGKRTRLPEYALPGYYNYCYTGLNTADQAVGPETS